MVGMQEVANVPRKRLAFAGFNFTGASANDVLERVIHQRITCGGHVNANLVGPSGQYLNLNQGLIV